MTVWLKFDIYLPYAFPNADHRRERLIMICFLRREGERVIVIEKPKNNNCKLELSYNL